MKQCVTPRCVKDLEGAILQPGSGCQLPTKANFAAVFGACRCLSSTGTSRRALVSRSGVANSLTASGSSAHGPTPRCVKDLEDVSFQPGSGCQYPTNVRRAAVAQRRRGQGASLSVGRTDGAGDLRQQTRAPLRQTAWQQTACARQAVCACVCVDL